MALAMAKPTGLKLFLKYCTGRCTVNSRKSIGRDHNHPNQNAGQTIYCPSSKAAVQGNAAPAGEIVKRLDNEVQGHSGSATIVIRCLDLSS
jgi:hypothetical protein